MFSKKYLVFYLYFVLFNQAYAEKFDGKKINFYKKNKHFNLFKLYLTLSRL
jgi:hypothetical protein